MTVTADTPTRDEAIARLGAAFKGVLGAVRRVRGRDTHRPGLIGFAQYHLLFGLADTDLSTGELAVAADLSPATVTQMLDGLETAGLVVRRRSERDRRIVTCALTDRGREAVAERRAHMETRWDAALAEFAPQELAAAAAVLERVRTMFEELDAER